MLSDEEKEALRNFKSEYETCNHNSSDLIIELDDAKTILNLIDKQQKEIDKQNKVIREYEILLKRQEELEQEKDILMSEGEAVERCGELLKIENSDWIGISNQVAISIVLNLIGKQSSVLNKIKQLTKVIICDEDGKLQKMIYADELYETFRELEEK